MGTGGPHKPRDAHPNLRDIPDETWEEAEDSFGDAAFYLLKSREGKSISEFVLALNDQPIF